MIDLLAPWAPFIGWCSVILLAIAILLANKKERRLKYEKKEKFEEMKAYYMATRPGLRAMLREIKE